jgi:hypothetical protein
MSLSAGFLFALADAGNQQGSLHAFDVSDPTAPTLRGTVPVSGTEDLALGHDFGLVLGSEQVHYRLQRFEITPNLVHLPEAPIPLGEIVFRRLAVLPGTGMALVSGQDVGLLLVDTQGPAAGEAIRLLGNELPTTDVQAIGNVVYLAAMDAGLWALQISRRAPYQIMLPTTIR